MVKKILSLALLVSASTLCGMTSHWGERSDEVSTFYLRAEGGVSFSRKADICVDTTVWDPAPEGYNNDLGNKGLVGLGFGYNFNDWLSLGVSSNYRGIFEYCKPQTATPDQNAPSPLGNKTRFFNFDSTSYMLDLYFNRTGTSSHYSWDLLDCMPLAPYAGVSVGFAVNELWNFRTVRQATFTSSNNQTQNIVNAIYLVNKKIEFAWQVAFGLEWSFDDCASFAIGYRYFDGGRLPFNNFNVDNLPDQFIPGPAVYNPDEPALFVQTVNPAWKGDFRANELVISFTAAF